MDLSTRTGLDKIARDTRQALAMYFNSNNLGDYILRWSRMEDADELADRRERTLMSYRNYVREIIQKYLEGIYRRQDSIQRSSPDPEFNKFLNGYYDAWFRREAAAMLLLLPETYFMIVPVAGGGFRPVVVFPQYITNFQITPDQQIVTIDMKLKDKECMKIDGENVIYYSGSVDQDGKLSWFPRSEEDGGIVAHNLKFCPVVRASYEENVEIATIEGTPAGHSFMYPVIQEAQADLQYRSMLVEAAHGHLFYQLIMGSGTATETLKTGMGSNMPIIETPEEHGSTRYLPKPSFEIEALKDLVYKLNPAEIFEIARLQSRFSSSAQTGAARAYDLYPENGVLTNIANYFWEVDDRIVQMLAKAMNVSAEVRYPTVFDTRSASDTLRDAQTFQAIAKDAPVSPMAVREMIKDAQRSLLPGLPTETLIQIDKETDRAPIPFLQMQQAELAQLPQNGGGQPQKVGSNNRPKPNVSATGPGEGGEGTGNGAPSKPSGPGPDNGNPGGNRQEPGPNAMGDGGDNSLRREMASGMAITLVANCQEGEEEAEYEQILEGLAEAGYEVSFLNCYDSLETLFTYDGSCMIWNAVEGFHDKAKFEMNVAAFFELSHFKFTGSGAKALGLIQDKAITKTVLAGVGLNVKRAVLLKRSVDFPDMSYLAWPRMVKPAAEDASEGITSENVTHNDEEMNKVISRLFTTTDSILVEEYIEGREILVGVLGNGRERIVLPPMEIEFIGDAKIVTQDAKQKAGSKDYDEVVSKDAVLTDTERLAIEEAVLIACRALEIQDYARVDLRLTPEGVPVIIEINPNPDLSPDHGFGGSAQLAGIPFPQLLDRIVKIAKKRYEPRGA